uniref:RRM domain-containing protein n=1 Tax=Strigamia maritima TaxID=126957 RepID=T1J867_STRMM
MDLGDLIKGQIINPGRLLTMSRSWIGRMKADSRSIYINNVNYTATAAELQEHFITCGSIKRVTTPQDRTGRPKGIAYIEFDENYSVAIALALHETIFQERSIGVFQKRSTLRIKRAVNWTNRKPNTAVALTSKKRSRDNDDNECELKRTKNSVPSLIAKQNLENKCFRELALQFDKPWYFINDEVQHVYFHKFLTT